MKTDRTISDAIFSGDSRAFSRFIDDNEDLFKAYFRKHYPTSRVSLDDVFQEASIELWDQIVDGKMTKEKLVVDLSTYLVSIGLNKFREETRAGIRIARIKDTVPHRRKRKEENEIEDDGKHSLQSEKAQRELDTNLNPDLYKASPRPVILSEETEFDRFSPEQKKKWSREIETVVWKMEEPCRSVLRKTWWDNLTDEQIMNESDGLFNTAGAVKVRRYRCHKKLQTALKSYYEALIN